MTAAGSPVWDDVMRVWTDPHGAVEAGQREGRSRADAWRAVLLYGLGIAFSLVLNRRLGADKLLDSVLGADDQATIHPALEPTFWAAAVGALATLLLVQWLVLPSVSRLFGGSPARRDANLAVYFLFCVGFLAGFAGVVSDLAGVIVHRFWPSTGAYLVLAGSLAIIALAIHQSARLATEALALASYPRGLAVLTLSLAAGLVAAALFFYGVLMGTLTLFPELLD
ncbi:MAG: hypothetical protein O9308_15225 [Beijerinckiaceae bacterium]|nr:hypothetical protein [Beijerinckiaceae bacterium]